MPSLIAKLRYSAQVLRLGLSIGVWLMYPPWVLSFEPCGLDYFNVSPDVDSWLLSVKALNVFLRKHVAVINQSEVRYTMPPSGSVHGRLLPSGFFCELASSHTTREVMRSSAG